MTNYFTSVPWYLMVKCFLAGRLWRRQLSPGLTPDSREKFSLNSHCWDWGRPNSSVCSCEAAPACKSDPGSVVPALFLSQEQLGAHAWTTAPCPAKLTLPHKTDQGRREHKEVKGLDQGLGAAMWHSWHRNLLPDTIAPAWQFSTWV